MLVKDEKELEKIFSWARYLYWADIQRQHFIDYERDHQAAEGAVAEWQLFAASSQWLASMWVVIEGWYELRMKDEVIDRLLTEWSHYRDLLKRYRNGVYHYQPKLLDERFHAFKREGSDFGIWVFALYLEFQRFLWEWPDRLNGTKEQVQALREMLVEIIGWMPEEIIPARKRALQDLCQDAVDKVRASGDTTSKAAQDLLRWAVDTQRMLKDLPDAPLLDCVSSMKRKVPTDNRPGTGERSC